MIREIAPAKLTLTLSVLGTRADGYHELDALTVTVSEPHDVVDVYPRDGPVTIEVTGRAEGVPADATNLAVRAAQAVGRGAHIELRKAIPPGAGLGGGSSDAAAVLRALTPGRAAEIAPGLGADIPFCVRGGAAWMRGVGEVLEPVTLREPIAVVIAVPPFPLLTPAVYRAWDELGGPHCERAAGAPPALVSLVDALVNDLEPAADAVEARLRAFRADLERVVGVTPVMAGSGSAYAACVADLDTARATAARVRKELSVSAWAGIAPAGDDGAEAP